MFRDENDDTHDGGIEGEDDPCTVLVLYDIIDGRFRIQLIYHSSCHHMAPSPCVPY